MASMYELEKMLYWHDQQVKWQNEQIKAMCAIIGIDPTPMPEESTPEEVTPEQTDPDA